MADDLTSADQDAWVEIAQSIKEKVRRYAANIPAMNPEELAHYIEATHKLMWLEVNAHAFDRNVELEQAKLFGS